MFDGIIPIDTPKHHFKNIREAKKWAKENIIGFFKNENTDEEISVSKSAIDKCLSESAVKKSASFDAHLSTLMQLPKLLETSVLKEIAPDRLNDSNIDEIRRFLGAVIYERKIYPVKITVKVIKCEGSKAYSYEVMQIESPITQNELPDYHFLGGIHGDRIHLTDRPTSC